MGGKTDTKRPNPFVRLKELTAVTEEYAELGAPVAGLAAVAGGIWTLAAIPARLVLGPWGWLPGFLTPGVLAALTVAGSRYYSPHGDVLRVARTSPRNAGWWFGKLVAIAPVLLLCSAATWAAGGGAERWIAFAVACCAAAAFAFVHWNRLLTSRNVDMIVLLILGGAMEDPSQRRLTLAAVMAMLGGLALLVSGLDQHRRFRALERRMAALRAAGAERLDGSEQGT